MMQDGAMVRELLRPLEKFFNIPGVTEICINRPGEVWTEAGPSWERHDTPELDFNQCNSLAKAVASHTEQILDQDHPILSAQLPGGQRIQICIPPITERGVISMTIRIPDPTNRTLDQYTKSGFFSQYRWALPQNYESRKSELREEDQVLVENLRSGRFEDFIKLAVARKKNIAVVGDTGSGKTTFMKTICQEIPTDNRIITIEDVREIYLPRHGNVSHLTYSQGGQGAESVTPAKLIISCMRMKPDRVLLAELRGSEAFDFLKLLTTGHSGAITSYHAESCALAAERFVFMAKEHDHAQIYDADSLKRLIKLTIDVIIHIEVVRVYDEKGNPLRKDRFISEISFDPVGKLKEQFGEGRVYKAGS
ncbi:P-type DNA transfer ATPase VirB11 (plasmid) [Ampullimonas aquatilis]|uniref:P-type DNA transfer ATPase VirB11 n=1 Tax=Ampullimonas aquatilis TaxID=1341549 RepID=UPI003C708FBF